MFVFSPYITVAIRAESHDTIFVWDPKTVKRVCTHHEEEVKHLRRKRRNQQRNDVIRGKNI